MEEYLQNQPNVEKNFSTLQSYTVSKNGEPNSAVPGFNS